MIKITRSAKPTELTDAKVKELTDEYKKTKKSVWQQKYIKDELLSMSNNKCCYCEVNITEQSKYLEVEHFHDKDTYPDEVVIWDNLLPSCKKCNGTKGSHDTKKEPIINPCNTNPNIHIQFWRYRLKGIDTLGKTTISVLDLNNMERHCKKRFEIGHALQEQLEELDELLDDYISGKSNSTRRKNRIIKKFKNLLRNSCSDKEYSAISSTILLTEKEYLENKTKMESLGFWDTDLQGLEKKLEELRLVEFEIKKKDRA